MEELCGAQEAMEELRGTQAAAEAGGGGGVTQRTRWWSAGDTQRVAEAGRQWQRDYAV